MPETPPTQTDHPPLPVHIDSDGPFAGIATLTLEQPGSPVVVLDEPLIRRIEVALQSLPRAIAGFVLASASPRVFIAGADLKTIQVQPADPEADRRLDAYLAYGQRVFGLIAALHCPTAAAIGGAALGGGLEIAMHCDALIGAPNASGKPYPIGLPEAGLAICPGWGGTNLLPARVNPIEAIRRTCAGKPMIFDEAVEAKLFDSVASSPDALLDSAKRWIVNARSGYAGGIPPRDGTPLRWIGRAETRAAILSALEQLKPELSPGASAFTPSARACVAAITAGLERGWKSALAVERRELVHLRGSSAGRAAIQAFFDRSKK